MAKTIKNIVISAIKELRAIRSEKEALMKKESELKKIIEPYLLALDNETLTTAECTAKIRHSKKFKVSDEAEAVNISIMLKKYDCLKINGSKFADMLRSIDQNTDLSLYGRYVDEVAIFLTYRKK